jgi:hypothetical protein
VSLKEEDGKGGVGGERGMRLLGFVALVCVWVYSVVVVEGDFVRDCRMLVLCTIGTVG